LLILDDVSAFRINNHIGAVLNHTTGLFDLDCDTTGLDDLTIFLGGGVFTLPPSAYVLRESGTCVSGISNGVDATGAIFGDAFLREYYSIYDKEAGAVGFAKAVHNSTDVQDMGLGP
jgi:saccharopepsin